MTPTTIIWLGVLVLLAVLVGYLVPTLIQIRKTALAAEELLRGIRPRIEAATSNLDSVLARMDRVMRGMEDGTRGITGVMGSVGSFLSHLRPPMTPGRGVSNWFAAISSTLSGVWQAWSVISRPGHRAAAAARDGGSHE
jgi:hypothetical protein